MNLSDFLSTSVMTRVAVLDNDSLTPLFTSAHPMRVSVTQEKTATKFPVEDGTDRSDHVFKQLVEIQIDFAVVEDLQEAYESLYQVWDQNLLVTVQTKVRSFENMLIVSLPHDETSYLGSGVMVPLRFQEWVEVVPEQGELSEKQVADEKQASTVKRGQVTGTEASSSEQKKGSVLSEWFS